MATIPKAEVGRAALELGVGVHDLVLLGGVLQEDLKVEPVVWTRAPAAQHRRRPYR